MKYVLGTAALAFALYPLAAGAQPVYVSPPAESSLTVQGDGLAERAPDQARVNAEIITNDDNAATSASRNNDIYTVLKGRLASIGLNAEALRTTSFNVAFVPHPPRGLPPEQLQPRYGYVTTRYIVVVVSPIENVGKTIDAATAAGVTQVGNVNFELKDRKAAYMAALAAAMTDAKHAAAVVASAGDFSILHVKSVNVGYAYVPLRSEGVGRVMSASAMPPPTPTEIAPDGPIAVSAHVTVTYTIK